MDAPDGTLVKGAGVTQPDPASVAATPVNGNTNSNPGTSEAPSPANAEVVDDLAFAAEAAANAVEEADAEQQRMDASLMQCRICGAGSEDGRHLLRFLPVEHDVAALHAAPSVTTFSQGIALHIFCGKTASILPSVNQPALEILTKAGLKNKHGIGPEVNGALARTRCAIVRQEGAKEKQYYLVREFEAHLAAIRHVHINFVGDPPSLQSGATIPAAAPPLTAPPPNGGAAAPPGGATHYMNTPAAPAVVAQQIPLPHPAQGLPVPQINHSYYDATAIAASTSKQVPLRAAAGMVTKTRQAMTSDGRVRCGCGGTHWPAGTPRGMASWKAHVMTKRHQKWMEANGLMGAV